MLRFVAILALGVMAAVMLVAVAGAGQPIRETIHVEEEFVEADFCGAPGLTVNFRRVADLRIRSAPRGKGGLLYFAQHVTRTDVVTNLANGRSVSAFFRVLEKDLRVTDNGDGTLTIRVLATGNAVMYGSDGRPIARDPGQVRFEVLIDHGGTPNDPTDDELLDFRLVKDSTGRSDDFCAAAVRALT
ncbi:MAG: hypothetical protein M3P42_02360 [Actinomycetota bacterium]|nr:hypothetical protein [Actinomycetota bacterium]